MNNNNNHQEQSAENANETIYNQKIKNKSKQEQEQEEEEEEEEEYEALKEACIDGDINIIKEHLFSENNNINTNFDINKLFEDTVVHDNGLRYFNQGSLLHLSCKKGYLEIVKLLCSHPNINLNQTNQLGKTPLYEACLKNHLNIIQFLCEIPEIDINLGDNHNRWTPLHHACSNNKIEIVKILLKQQNRIGINKQNIYTGNSALHIAYFYGFLEIVKLLCEQENENNKIDINLRNNEGKTPFYIACEKGKLEIAKYLFLKYNNSNFENQISNNGFSPLHISCKKGNYEIVKFLLENNIFND